MLPLSQIPANNIRTSNIIYDGIKSLFGNNIKTGIDANQIIEYISQLFEDLYKHYDLDCVDLATMGIECPDPNMSKECIILNHLIQNDADIKKSFETMLKTLTTINESIGLFTDEMVAISPGAAPGYLQDILIGAPGVFTKQGDNLVLAGTVPLGFTGSISKSRVTDFDMTGKGKANTDVWGWAIRNGNNGTENVLGTFPRYANDTSVAGRIAGNDSVVIDMKNVKSMTLPVNGTISQALEDGVTFKLKVSKALYHFGVGASHYVVDFPAGNDATFTSDPLNFKHTHAFSLTAAHNNPNPVPLDLLPKHYTEIPIQRINP